MIIGVWKGDISRNVRLLTGVPADPDAWVVEDRFQFERGHDYLVYAIASQGALLTTSACSRAMDHADDKIAALTALAVPGILK
jgi:hypothetical protein